MNDMLEANMEPKAVHQSYNEEPSSLGELEIKQKIVDTIYSHYGKPSNIIEEKLTLYKNYSTPAGYSVPDWNDGGWQRGRFSVYVSNDNLIRISDSWFFHTDGNVVKTFLNGEPDAILEILGKN